MTIVTLNINPTDLKTIEACFREHFAENRYGSIEVTKIQATLSTKERFESITVFVEGPGSKFCFNKGDYHENDSVYFEIASQNPMLFVQRCNSEYVYVSQGYNRCCNTFHSGQHLSKYGQLTKRVSNILWSADPHPYTVRPLLRSAKAILYELRNKVTLHFSPADLNRIEDCLRENFDEARYRNVTIDSVEGIRSPKTSVINPIIKGQAYCYNTCDYHNGVYFEINTTESWFQQCCYNTLSASREGQISYCELFKSGSSINKTGKLSKKVMEIFRNPLSMTSNESDEHQDPVHGTRWSRANGRRLCTGKDNTCKNLAKGEKPLCIGCGGGESCISQNCSRSAQYNHDGYCRKHYKQLYNFN